MPFHAIHSATFYTIRKLKLYQSCASILNFQNRELVHNSTSSENLNYIRVAPLFWLLKIEKFTHSYIKFDKWLYSNYILIMANISVAEAKNKLPHFIHQTEVSGPIIISRRFLSSIVLSYSRPSIKYSSNCCTKYTNISLKIFHND